MFAAPFLNLHDPSLGMFELAGHEGWLAPSRFFRRFLDAVSGDTLGVVARVAFAAVLLAVVVILVHEVWRSAQRTSDERAAAFELGASWGWSLLFLMLLGPILLPWYVVWALPLVWLVPRVPRLVLLGTSVALGGVAVDRGARPVPRRVRHERARRSLPDHAGRDRLTRLAAPRWVEEMARRACPAG